MGLAAMAVQVPVCLCWRSQIRELLPDRDASVYLLTEAVWQELHIGPLLSHRVATTL